MKHHAVCSGGGTDPNWCLFNTGASVSMGESKEGMINVKCLQEPIQGVGNAKAQARAIGTEGSHQLVGQMQLWPDSDLVGCHFSH